MEFYGHYRGRPVRGVMLRGRVIADVPEAEAAIREAVEAGAEVYIAGVFDGRAALSEGPAGYATLATVLDGTSARFDTPLEVEPLQPGDIP